MAVGQRAVVGRTEAAVALAAATPKSILALLAPASDYIKLSELAVMFDGVSAAEKPVLVELCRSTQATAGTTTSGTPQIVSGQGTASSSVRFNYTVEPTVLSVVRHWLVDPYKGMLGWQFPLGKEPETQLGGAFVLRCTVPTGGAAVNAQAYMEVEDA